MKIAADENIIFAEEAFSQFGEVVLMNGREISNRILKDAEILITRSVTNVNEKLLRKTPVKFVGTATIGTDHIDLEYLERAGIKFSSAPGCNSQAVAEYVFSALFHLGKRFNFELRNKSIGIIGVGNIGRKVKSFAEKLGMKTYPNDPPRARAEGSEKFTDLRTALGADIVTLHVPLNLGGVDNTFHLIGGGNICFLKPGAVLINASRGETVDNQSLLARLKQRADLFTVLDVWENEPNINFELLKLVNIATPHIAGYSLEGKANGTKMIYNSLADFLSEPKIWLPNLPKIKNNKIKINNSLSEFEKIYSAFNYVYPILKDSADLKSVLKLPADKAGEYFDRLRKNYRLRRELANYDWNGFII